jgi:hypothetical protein
MMATTSESKVVLAPNPYTKDPSRKAVFLSGSIESVTPNWQTRVTTALSHLPITILNPLRTDWDSTWREDISDERFHKQVLWELEMMEAADILAIYFAPDTQAAITLLELGLSAKSGRVLIACPRGYWKRGNIQVVCERYKIELLDSVDELIEGLLKRLE